MSRRAISSLLALCLIGAANPAAVASDGMQPPDHVVGSSIVERGAEPWLDLAYDWSVGQSETMTVEMWEASVTSMEGWVSDEHPGIPFRLTARVTVESVDADGTAVIETVVDRVELAAVNGTEAASTLLTDLRTLVGVRHRERLDSKGYLLASEVIDPLEDASDLHSTRNTARDSLEHLTTRLPLEPIGAGGVWIEVVDITADSGATETDTITKTLLAIETGGALRIQTDATMSVPQQAAPAEEFGLDDAVLSGDAAGALVTRLDPRRLTAAFSGTQSGTGEVFMPSIGKGVTFDMQLLRGIAVTPEDWADPNWPLLPPIEATDLPGGVPAVDVEADPRVPGSIDVVVLDHGAAPRRELRYALAEGQVEDSAIVMTIGMRLLAAGEWTPWIGMPATEVAATTTVTNVRDDGSYDIEILYTEVGVPAGSATLPPESLEEMEAQMSNLVGMKQVIHMDDRGHILSAETSLPPGARLEDLQTGQLDAMTEDLAIPLPTEPVGLGAVWEVASESSDAMGFLAYGADTMTLVEIDPQGRLHLEGEMDMTADPGPMAIEGVPASIESTLERFSLDGEFMRAVDLGLVNPEGLSQGIADYAFTVAFGDTAERTEMQMSIEAEAWLVAIDRG